MCDVKIKAAEWLLLEDSGWGNRVQGIKPHRPHSCLVVVYHEGLPWAIPVEAPHLIHPTRPPPQPLGF